MPYPISTPGQDSDSGNSKQWPAFPGIPIFLETHDERKVAKTYGTTPTTPTTPEVLVHNQQTPSSRAHLSAPEVSPVATSPTTTIQTSSARSSIWPIPEPPPEIQSRRPALQFFPTQRPRVRHDVMPTLQIPQFNEKPYVNEKTPINITCPGLGIVNGLPKPPSIEVTSPVNETTDTTFNIAQRIEEKLWRYSADGNIVQKWLLEIISWLFSAICMAAVIGVLIYLRDDPLSKWALAEKTGLTLNTYISILSKMAGAALILPVSEALGQLKWSWFLEHSKQMWDFEIFDNASRGPWGSMLLLLRTKGRALAAIGAMIMLCSLALDPFFQQVVDYPDRWALQDTSSTLPRVARYKPGYNPAYQSGVEISSEDQALAVTLRSFFFDNGTQPVIVGNGTRPDIPLSCSTSNCTWPEYETLAVCSSCSDVTNSLDLKFSCRDTSIDWSSQWLGPLPDDPYPNGTVCGYFLNSTSESPILLSGYILNDTDGGNTTGEALLVRTVPLTDFDTKLPLYDVGSIAYKSIRNPMLDALVASVENGVESVYGHERPVVHECMLAWCVQNIRSSYEWGKYSENITAVHLETTSKPSEWPWTTFEADTGTFIVYTQNLTLEPPGSFADRSNSSLFDATYGIDNTTMANIMNVFDDIFPSFYTATTPTARPELRFKNYLGYAPIMRKMTLNPWEGSNNITRHMERLATAMSNVVRSSASNTMISGQAYSKENYVSVRWEWLTLPLGLLFTALIFLAATIAKSSVERDRVGVLKTSAYATLLYGLPDEMQNKITRSSSTGTPRSKAKELKVKLQANGGWRISGNVFTPFTPKPRLNQPPPGWI
ncbi:hypothetical protein N0V91_011131 [Didymella pomorum]|uniref:DUF3176 domain containing protein n=1 Tax=Didymella pomorum TaxID=749634 RepID=A0A9W9D0R2_9PLEO|nr:hypothetical protein N0V91_011131 [Didymella pomorum]